MANEQGIHYNDILNDPIGVAQKFNALLRRVFLLPTGIAAAADMEAASSATLAVPPSLQHRHPGHPKAWCRFDGTGTPAMTGTPYNFSATITDNGAGDYTVTFTTGLSNTSGCVLVTGSASNYGTVAAVTATTIQVVMRDATGAATDDANVNIVVFGDQ